MDHENCNGRGSFWDGSKCGSCLSPWTGDNCEEINPCNWNGNWIPGTGCDCTPWTTASSNCSFNLNLAISCYYGNAQNDTGYGPYCSCGGGAYGTQCELLLDYKSCITGSVISYVGNGSQPWPTPECKCPDESYTLNSGNCDCSSGFSYENFGDPCTKNVVESDNNDSPESKEDFIDYTVVGLVVTIISITIGLIRLRVWHIQKKHEGRKITWRTYLSCLPFIDIINKREVTLFTTNSKITLSRSQSDSDMVSDIETDVDIETEIGYEEPTIVEPESNLGNVSKVKKKGHCSIL